MTSEPDDRTNGYFENVSAGTIATVLGGIIILLLTLPITEFYQDLGPIGRLIWFAGGLVVIPCAVGYFRYIAILGSGAKPAGSRERIAYDTLREHLCHGGTMAQIYQRRLTRFLDAVDRFFGDGTQPFRTLFPRAFGLRTPAPLWTAPSYDRCLLLALIYPVASIFVLWAVSGHVGPAETALHLPAQSSHWRRALIIFSLLLELVAYTQFIRMRGWKRLLWLVIACAVGGAVAVASADAVVGIGVFGGAIAVAVAGAGAGVVGGAGAVAVAGVGAGAVVGIVAAAIAGIVAIAVAGAGAVVGVVAVIVAGAVAVAVVDEKAKGNQYQGIFLIIITFVLIISCFSASYGLSSFGDWTISGPILLFLGLFSLINAPFDWASLGVTRALLRRGIELGGWWPYGLALVDAVLAVAIIALLSATMVLGVQAFDHVAVLGGGAPVLCLQPSLDAHIPCPRPLFDGIAVQSAAPEYWWVYMMLLSTMIPSLVNLAISGASLMRGIPGVPALLLARMVPGEAVPGFERSWMALLLTGQWVVGIALGLVAQGVLVWVILFGLLPGVGFSLLGFARDVASLDLPARLF